MTLAPAETSLLPDAPFGGGSSQNLNQEPFDWLGTRSTAPGPKDGPRTRRSRFNNTDKTVRKTWQ